MKHPLDVVRVGAWNSLFPSRYWDTTLTLVRWCRANKKTVRASQENNNNNKNKNKCQWSCGDCRNGVVLLFVCSCVFCTFAEKKRSSDWPQIWWCNSLIIHVFWYCVVVKCDHLTAKKLNSPGIFGMAYVWHGASLPDLNDKAILVGTSIVYNWRIGEQSHSVRTEPGTE